MLARVVPAFALFSALGMLSGLAAGTNAFRRSLSLALALGCLAAPFVIPAEHTALRAVLALGGVAVLIRAVDLARDPATHAVPLRIGLMFSLLDLRAVAAQAPRAELRRFALALGCGATSIAAHWAALHAEPRPLRWLFGAVAVYVTAEGANQLTLFGWHAAGFRIPTQHRAPILSTSASEFWSRRWNLNVRDWLYRHCHRPLARRGRPALGVIAAFAASTLIHYWFIAVALGSAWGLVMASYFVVQGVIVLAESRLALSSWPTGLRRAWTIAVVGGPSPLFVEPWLRLLE